MARFLQYLLSAQLITTAMTIMFDIAEKLGPLPAYVPAERKRSRRAAALSRIEFLSRFLDDAFRIPVIGMRVGFDGLIGLIPGVGDAVGATLSGYMIWEAWRAGVSKTQLAKMAGLSTVDFLFGSIPIVGDLFDFAFKSNRRIARRVRRELQTDR